MQILTNSRRQSFDRCPRNHYYAYELCRRPRRKSDALYFGTIFHNLRALYRSHDLAAALTWLDQQTINEWNQLHLIIASELIQGYANVYWNDPMLPLPDGIEREFTAPLINPLTLAPSRTWLLAGKNDELAIHPSDGTTVLVEAKTTSEDLAPDSTYWMRLTLDPQISTYYVGATSLGFEPKQACYDVIHKPKFTIKDSIPVLDPEGIPIVKDQRGARVLKTNGTPRRTADSAKGFTLLTRQETLPEFAQRLATHISANTDFYFKRFYLPRTETDLEEFMFDTWQIARNIRDCQLRQAQLETKSLSPLPAWPRKPRSCFDFHRPCSYFQICAHTENILDNNRFETTPQNPELDITAPDHYTYEPSH